MRRRPRAVRVSSFPRIRLIIGLSVLLLARPLHAQSSASPAGLDPESGCDYRKCALVIAPRWNGLAVVAGDGGATLANLHFLLPHDLTIYSLAHAPIRRVATASGVALMLSLPVHFAADGALSRAVWWHNLRYAR
jgi:hypothetical protein